jgi:hypothetical protein
VLTPDSSHGKLSGWLYHHFSPEDRDSMLLQNIGIYQPVHMVQKPEEHYQGYIIFLAPYKEVYRFVI